MSSNPMSLYERLHKPGAATAHCPISARDVAILHFLWKWKVATTTTLHAATGGGGTAYASYKALARLERLKFITCKRDERSRFFYWELTKSGYQVIHEELGDLREEGFRSENVWHDLNVLAFHLGEWVLRPSVPVEFFTEQAFRRMDRDRYPEWVNATAENRPDGLSRLQSSKGKLWTLAYEVELTAKSQDRYEAIIRNYRMCREYDLVLWLVGSREVKSQIFKVKAEARDPADSFHLFVDHAQYVRDGWRAEVKNVQDRSHGTIAELMQGILGALPEPCQDVAGECFRGTLHYDPRKSLRFREKVQSKEPGEVLTV